MSKNWTRLGFLLGVGILLAGAALIFVPLFLPPASPIWIWSLCYNIGSMVAILGGLMADISLLWAVASRLRLALQPSPIRQPSHFAGTLTGL